MNPAATRALQGRTAVERYFEVSLFLLIATGFLTLASTGRLDILSLLFMLTVLGARAVLLVRDRSIVIPEKWSTFATILYALFFAADFLLVSRNFVSSMVHLVLFIMAFKIFSVQRERDHLYLAVLSFGMVLLAALLTVDSIFFFAFCLFLILATSTFVSMEMKRSAANATARAHEVEVTRRRLARWLSATSVILVVGTIASGFFIFFILPRPSGGYMNSLAQTNQFVTGFSNDVMLGRIGELKRSSEVVMHIQISGDEHGEHSDLKWRGVGLSLFDGQRWTNPAKQCLIHAAPEGYFQVQVSDAKSACYSENTKERGLRTLRYRVLMEPIGTDIFFVAPSASALLGRYRGVWKDANDSIGTNDQPIGAYDVVSNLAEATPEKLRGSSGAIPAEIARLYTKVPPKLDPRIAALAASVTGNSPSTYDRAVALENFLQTKFGYTLELPKIMAADPVADFLFRRKQGHCEYFASAMAVMLRTQGIPSRVVNGFRGAEFNDITSTYIVRASSAHTWVEAYFPGFGWITFDPTPADPKPAVTRFSRLALYIDALGEFWREWVINYDVMHQIAINRQIFNGSQHLAGNWREALRKRYHALLHWVRGVQLSEHRRRNALLAAAGLALVLLASMSRRIIRFFRTQSIAARPAKAPRVAATIWYERMTRIMAQRGCAKSGTQTPQEFVDSILDPELRRSVAIFTQYYERARFGEMAEDAAKLPELYDELSKTR
jgi:transglutaminase-like putative cysteine protease